MLSMSEIQNNNKSVVIVKMYIRQYNDVMLSNISISIDKRS